MLGVLCATRPKPWLLSLVHASLPRLAAASLSLSLSLSLSASPPRRHHSTACKLLAHAGGAASIWHAIRPRGAHGFRLAVHDPKGEGSWNVAWDARPARWLHRSDSAWLLFGVCACLAPPACADADADAFSPDETCGPRLPLDGKVEDEVSADYRITGVPADGRCLFRAIAHGACLRNGEKAPDENRQRELADELRAKVVDELLKRREETEWFIEGDFDTYVKRIQQPYVWGGEPELLMASHVLKTPISVFMRDTGSLDLVNIAKYGEEYRNQKEISIDVLFHGYGHYDILETL
ncbi:OTU domain-containing protein At3g57810 [Cajanus cajan]|uniref:Ubiquitin thioesterase OTU n=1 Tax=Cajanus cajan TaxID=3821 RepID=A0A151R7B8_CAJCA|nr:OTU domain-containing protein At3g57810 [Cajanus cajan]KYP38396.1 OTU domain-containing protein 6B [Cajanus cajan]